MIPEDVKRVLRKLQSFCGYRRCKDCPFYDGVDGCKIRIGGKLPLCWPDEVTKEE